MVMVMTSLHLDCVCLHVRCVFCCVCVLCVCWWVWVFVLYVCGCARGCFRGDVTPPRHLPLRHRFWFYLTCLCLCTDDILLKPWDLVHKAPAMPVLEESQVRRLVLHRQPPYASTSPVLFLHPHCLGLRLRGPINAC